MLRNLNIVRPLMKRPVNKEEGRGNANCLNHKGELPVRGGLAFFTGRKEVLK